MFIPVGCAVTAVEIEKKEECFCNKCFFYGNEKVCEENSCFPEDRQDGKRVIYLLKNVEIG
jgi:hypothetical protein